MAHLHLIFGVALFVAFLVTGRFMRWDLPDKEIVPPELRILMRSRHIYILLSSLIHIVLGVYVQLHAEIWRRVSQTLGSLLLIAGSLLLVWAFVYEAYTTRQFSEISRSALYVSLSGTALHLIGGSRLKK